MVRAAMVLLVGLAVFAPLAAAKNVWGAHKKKENQRKTKTSFEQLNDELKEPNFFDSSDSTEPLTRLMELVVTENLDAIGLASHLVDTVARHFKSEETRTFFTQLNLRDLMRSAVEGAPDGGESVLNNEMMMEIFEASGTDIYDRVMESLEVVSSYLLEMKTARASKRKLKNLLADFPEEMRALAIMFIELDSDTIRSLLAGAVSSLQPIEQLMINKLLSGDINGWLGLWRQYLQKDGEIERIRRFLLPAMNTLPDELKAVVQDKVTFENYLSDLFQATGKQTINNHI